MAICRGYAVTILSQLLFFFSKLLSKSTPKEVVAVRGCSRRGRGEEGANTYWISPPECDISSVAIPGWAVRELLWRGRRGCTRMPK